MFPTLLLLTLGAQAAATPSRMVAATNVRLRAEPSEEVRIVTHLPLGAEVAELETSGDRRWVRVRTQDGDEGWLYEPLSKRFSPSQRLTVARSIVFERLRRQGDGVAAGIELISFIDRLLPDLPDRGAQAQFALLRLQAVRNTAEAGQIYFRKPSQVFDAWVKANTKLLVYTEPGAQWLLRRDAILAEADRFAGERAADQLAWLAVTNGLPGECEGDLFCYITWAMHLEGEYLSRHPTGTFVDQALTQLRNRFQDYWPPPDMTPWPDRCAPFLTTLDSLQGAVKNVTSRWSSTTNLRDRTLEALERYREPCAKSRGPR